MKSLSVSICLLIISVIACNNESSMNDSVEKDSTVTEPKGPPPLLFDRFLGTWKSFNGRSYERWVKNANGNYHSVGFRVKDNDTTWEEDINIYPQGNAWISENKVNGQNEGRSVKFTSTIFTENMVQFSNPAHDFPTDINYSIHHPDTLNAFIIGPNSKGGRDTIHFNFRRLK